MGEKGQRGHSLKRRVREKGIAQIYAMQPQEAGLELKQEGRREANLNLILGNTF